MRLASHWPPGAVPVAVTAWGINAPASRQGQSEAIAGVDRCRPAVHRAATSAKPSRRIRREPRRFPLLHAAQAPRCSPVQVLPRIRVKPCSGRRSRTAPPGASALLPLTTAPPSSSTVSHRCRCLPRVDRLRLPSPLSGQLSKRRRVVVAARAKLRRHTACVRHAASVSPT
jgi:hypothetical protein